MDIKWIPNFKEEFEKLSHEKYLQLVVTLVTGPSCNKYETHKILFLHCALNALRALNCAISPEQKVKVEEFLFNSQIETDDKISFAASPNLRFALLPSDWDIISTYLAISCAEIISSDLAFRQKDKLASFLDYFFDHNKKEMNIRQLYSFCAAKFLLKFSLDKQKTEILEIVKSHESFDGGFSLEPQGESHSAAVFCAIACLSLIGALKDFPILRALHWVVGQQNEFGFSVE